MSTTVESLLLLAEGKLKDAERRELANATQAAAHFNAILSNVFPKSIWEALGFPGAIAGTYDLTGGSLSLDFEVTARGWSMPMRFEVKHHVVLYINQNSSLILKSGNEYHAENAANLSVMLLKAIDNMPQRLKAAIAEWLIYVENAEANLDLSLLHDQAGAIQRIPTITPEMIDELNNRIEQARVYISSTLDKRQKAASRLIALSRSYFNELAVYDEACRRWAEENTEALWQPWMLWKVRYSTATNGNEPSLRAPVEEIYTDTHPEKVRSKLYCSAYREDGGIETPFYIGSFFSSTPCYFNSPSITEELPFHVHYAAGKFFVNVPASLDRSPTPFDVQAPAPWPEYVRERFKDVVLFGDLTAEAVSEMSVEALAKRMVFTVEVLS